jgi:gephyrin
MARPVAGIRKHTLILTLPGSPKGAKENLEAILRLLPHACIQAAGAESRLLHIGGVKKLEKDAGVSPIALGNGCSLGAYLLCTFTNLTMYSNGTRPSSPRTWALS